MNEEVETMLRLRLEKHGEGERVFLNQDGKPWNRNSLGLRMRRLRERAGVKIDERGEEFVLYTNRHTFHFGVFAYALWYSESLRVDMAGHTSTGCTTRIYTHLSDDKVAGGRAHCG